MSWREDEWNTFAEEVRKHIVQYTLPQFGDFPHDQVTDWTPEDCVKAMRRYLARFDRGQRGTVEQERDFIKIAHYACMALTKYRGEKG